jgi:DNA-binding NtrC family response regulator
MPSSDPVQPLTVLVVDDEEMLVKSCRQILTAEGYQVLTETRGKPALEIIARQQPDIILTDLKLPDLDGMALLKEARASAPHALIVMITGFATVDSSVEAIEAGAYDYIPKPFTATQLRILIGRAAQQVQLARDNELLRHQLKQQHSFENIVGTGEAMQKVFSIISRVAPTEASVFLSGESGTGKELIARAIHTNSRRSTRPFVAINCAALPEHLLESELFGYERGAFTGAESQHRGLLEAAMGGTFFLDEICEMSPDLQAKLLRVIQERRIRRVGGEREIPIDVRLISATNQDPAKAVRDGFFRQDLYFRLNVVPIRLPPLRARSEDIPTLANHFLRHYAKQYDRVSVRLSSDALNVLRAYSWPGNVRELQNVIERVVSLAAPGEEIGPRDLPDELSSRNGLGWSPFAVTANRPYHEAKAEAMSFFEQEYLRDLLDRHAGNISRAARQAGMDRKTIHRMLTKYKLRSGRYSAASGTDQDEELESDLV